MIQQRKEEELPEYVTKKLWCSFHEEFIEVGSLEKQRVNLISWLPTGKGKVEDGGSIVYISHGLHEHVLKYHVVAEELTKRGMKVYGADHMGHGLTYGIRGLIRDHKQLISDQIEVIKIIRNLNPSSKKLFLLCRVYSEVREVIAKLC